MISALPATRLTATAVASLAVMFTAPVDVIFELRFTERPAANVTAPVFKTLPKVTSLSAVIETAVEPAPKLAPVTTASTAESTVILPVVMTS